ncbi:sulfite oxidase heme-binding subunit YedZ [Magnetococcus sp. PR-3]|uniref:sulfite oxidase heme-binding subunit YedZ n=1 Tax=Magnetococcus sp. PR-3 TaxID=3120355 RepID=UPI002FCDE758
MIPWLNWNRARYVLMLMMLMPIAWYTQQLFAGELGANPIESVIRASGRWSLYLLTATLSVTPLLTLTGYKQLGRFRRNLGVACFGYGLLHLLLYVGLDQFFDWAAIGKDILKRPFITIGMATFVLLLPLAMTSNNGMVRRLGGKRWKQLHKLVYLIAPMALIHLYWLTKADYRFAHQMALCIGILLIWRLWRSQPLQIWATKWVKV